MEKKVNEIVEVTPGVFVRVVPGSGCKGCYCYSDRGDTCAGLHDIHGECFGGRRSDGVSVKFIREHREMRNELADLRTVLSALNTGIDDLTVKLVRLTQVINEIGGRREDK